VIFRIIFSLGVLILLELLSFTTVLAWAKMFKPNIKIGIISIYVLLTVGFFIFFISFSKLRNWNENRELRAIVSVAVMTIFIFKLFVSIISLTDIVKRGIAWILGFFTAGTSIAEPVVNGMSRSKFFTNLAVLSGGTGAALMLYGMSNRYNYQVKKVPLHLPKWDAALKGLKIVQISDIHSGSFTSVAAVQKGIDKILALKPDIILFTGDLVNNIATEMEDYISVFAQLKAPLGVYSTLGNHDYGDYYFAREAVQEKAKNLQDLKNIHKQMGWQLLLNENVTLPYNNSEFVLIGVENISGSRGFHSYGNFNAALSGIEQHPHKILMSHDPSHWQVEVSQHPVHVDLTFSGHTHGMQFGIDIPGFKWSPIKYVYKQWAGLYKQNDRHLYVNRGFGFLGYPGRVGILPEITLIELT
jgi:uncharacterized protein